MDSNRMIGERIGKLITEKGITQQVLSDRIGVKRETVVQWLNGSRKIKAEHIIMLCKALNVSADYLLGLSEIESLDPDVKACYHYTGLSETALYTLHNYESEISATLSKLIEYHEFWHLLCDISNYGCTSDKWVNGNYEYVSPYSKCNKSITVDYLRNEVGCYYEYNSNRTSKIMHCGNSKKFDSITVGGWHNADSEPFINIGSISVQVAGLAEEADYCECED